MNALSDSVKCVVMLGHLGCGAVTGAVDGVFSLHNHQVSMPVNPTAHVAPENVNLAYAPTNPKEFNTMALHMAELLMPTAAGPTILPSAAASRTGNDQKKHGPKGDGLLLTRDDHLGMERPN